MCAVAEIEISRIALSNDSGLNKVVFTSAEPMMKVNVQNSRRKLIKGTLSSHSGSDTIGMGCFNLSFCYTIVSFIKIIF